MAEAIQAYLSDNSPAMLVLEGIVDRAGLRNVLFALEHICTLRPSTSKPIGKTACKVHAEYDTSIVPVSQ
jgi:hypothetical protein